jgi:hypothetical protein
MPFQINHTQVPDEKLNDQRFVSLFQYLQNRFADPKAVEEVCFHEGGHLHYYYALGASQADVDIPHINYDAERDEFNHTNGGVKNPKWGDEFTKLSPLDQAYYMAIVGAAGEIATTVLLGTGFGNGIGDRESFHFLCQQMRIAYNLELRIWRNAEEYVRKDLQNSVAQEWIRAKAKEVEPLIFKPL